MRTEPRWIVTGVLIAVLAGGICRAQEGDPPSPPAEDAPKPAAIEDETNKAELEKLPPSDEPDHRKAGQFYVEGGVWFVQPTGLEFSPAIAYRDSFQANVLEMPFRSETPARWRFGWELPKGFGEIIGTYHGYSQEQRLQATAPGDYVYGETQVLPLFAGAFDDGRSDGFGAQATTVFREIRFDYARRAFDSPRVRGKWFAGIRRVIQNWNLVSEYHSLIQPPELFPPIIPPLGTRPDLVPEPDISNLVSNYEGRGVEGGLDLKFPFDQAGKFVFEAGFAVAALRGKLHSDSFSLTHYYRLRFPEGDIDVILAPPFDIFTATLQPSEPGSDPVDALSRITQEDFAIRLEGTNISKSALALDAYLGFRWKVWRDLEVFGGFRDQHYDGAGEVVRPASATVLSNGSINVESVTRTPISTTYEGFYLGVAYLF